jgi:hypothetical protein
MMFVGWDLRVDAQTSKPKLSFKAETYSTNFDTGETSAEGDVKVLIGEQEILSQKVKMNNRTGKVIAQGDVIFKKGSLQIKSQNAEFDMDTGYGTFHEAVLTVENEFYLEARKLTRSAEKTYLAVQGKLTSCQDCPKAWSFVGANIEIELEAFARVHHGFAQILDKPIFYFPFFMFPIKTVRQSGFLFPRVSYSPELGMRFRQPYFYAPSKEWDLTGDYRFMTNGGHGMGLSFRSALGERSYFNAQTSYARNLSVPEVPTHRGALNTESYFQISPNTTMRILGEVSSDARYNRHFEDEFKFNERPSLVSGISFTFQGDNQWLGVGSEFHQDNIPRSIPLEPSIHKLPQVSYYVPSFDVFGFGRSSLEFESLNFWRDGAGIDPGSEWIREGQRHSLVSSWNFPLKFGSWIQYKFQIEGRGDAYRFYQVPSAEARTSAYRIRTQMEQEINTEMFRVFYINDNRPMKAIKHSWIPLLRWSYSPPDAKTDHLFFKQEQAPRFDLFDPNSPEVSFSQLGLLPEEKKFRNHHLFTVGLQTRLVGRYGDEYKVYKEHFAAQIEQDLSLSQDRIPRPAKITSSLSYDNITVSTKINLYLYGEQRGEGYFENTLEYKYGLMTTSLGQTILPGREIYFGDLGFAGWGYWSAGIRGYFDGLEKTFYGRALIVSYKNDSRCWNASVTVREEYNSRTGKNSFGIYPSLQVYFDEEGKKLGN